MRSVYELTFLGLDVHKDTISVGVLEPGAETAVVDKIPSDGPSVRRLISRFPDRSRPARSIRWARTAAGSSPAFDTSLCSSKLVVTRLKS